MVFDDVLPQDGKANIGAEPLNVYVLLTTQQGLFGPDVLDHRHASWEALVDPFLIRSSIYDWRTKTGRNDVQIMHDSLSAALGPFHFESSTMNIIGAAEAGTDWAVWDSEVVDSIETLGNMARRVFREHPVDYVLGVDARYFMSPGLDRVRVVFQLKLALGADRVGRAHVLFARQYEYLSESIGLVLRPFRPGEKEALENEMKEFFRLIAEEKPENSQIYEEEESRALEKLSKRKVIPPDLAIEEAWPNQSLARAVAEARRHMQHMIALDLQLLRGPEPAKGVRVPFIGIDSSGDPREKTGYFVDSLDGNTIYRDSKRNYYSVPKINIPD